METGEWRLGNLLAAFSLLTILPIKRDLDYSSRALSFFPVVGMTIGLILVSLQYLVSSLFPQLISAALVLIVWVILTGALHLDGVSDACDGLFAATSSERRLEILRDVHMGAFGATGLVLVLIAKFAALTSTNAAALILAPTFGRWAMVYAATFPLARRDGMAALFAASLTRREILAATLLTTLVAIPFGWLGVGVLLAAMMTTTLLAWLAIGRLGGLTGDIYGMVCECVEVSVLLAGSLWHAAN